MSRAWEKGKRNALEHVFCLFVCFILFSYLLFFILCIWLFCLQVCLCATCMQRHWPEEGNVPLELELQQGCELPKGCWELSPGPLQEQQMSHFSSPSIHSKTIIWQNYVWWSMPLNPALRKKRRVDLYEFQASLVYIASLRTARTTQWDLVSNNNNKSCFANNYAGCLIPDSTVILQNW